MKLTEKQIAFIRRDIRKKGIHIDDLAESLTDHLCCAIEFSTDGNFKANYNKALTAFGQDGFQKIQEETVLLIALKKEINMKKMMFLLGYMAAILVTTGLLFKIQHWPGAAIMLTSGVVVFNLGFLPLFFIQKFKSLDRNEIA